MFMDNKSLVLIAAKACDEKKAKDIKLIKIDKKIYAPHRVKPFEIEIWKNKKTN